LPGCKHSLGTLSQTHTSHGSSSDDMTANWSAPIAQFYKSPENAILEIHC
jgi:hypothetical protein